MHVCVCACACVCVCVCAMCVQGGPRWDICTRTTSLTVTENEWREFPPERTLHPPLAAALN